MYTIIGIENTQFKDRETGVTYQGVRLHCTYEKENMDGFAVESIYCNSRVDLEGITVGDVCEIYYNKFGKVSHVRKVA